MSAIDTRPIDQFRQGIYARGNYLKRGITPVLGPTITGSTIEKNIFGQSKTFSDDTPFEDLMKFDSVIFLEDTGSMYPVILGNVDIHDPDQKNGVIEPFSIRSEISFTTTEFPFSAKSIKADVLGGNSDSFLSSDQIVSEYPFEDPVQVDPFIDASDRMGISSSAAVRIPGFSPDDQKVLSPFIDNRSQQSVFDVAPSGQDMINALASMTGSSTENYMRNIYRSSGKGFSYENTYLGVDSVAFGGLKRS